MINPLNTSRLTDAYLSGEPSGDYFPSVYVMEPTSRCNLVCPMCPNSMIPNSQHGVMTAESAGIISKIIAPYAELVMLYFVGEPLMHPNIFEYIASVRSSVKGKLALSTNATLLDKKNREALLSSGIDIIICSIDGVAKEKFEKIRRGAIFEDVVTNVELLLKERQNSIQPEIVVKCIDINISDGEQRNFISHWTALGAKSHISWLNTWGGTFSKSKKASRVFFPNEGKPRRHCAELWFKMVINWRGDVVLCCVDWQSKVILGNILEDKNLNNIWHGQSILSLREKHLAHNWSEVSVCSTCTEWSDISEQEIYYNAESASYDVVF
jgi:radical SAM protein with 4Fe4S-binding SPASM domain